ncbi:MAG: hypothetical protein A2017_07375 [Lentisphaerae bacterium GWF2_44_16]|nr:MAG: hypothetical protein A2017_07375 [Lentisphaerae bacterium GWF2_44_16]
MANKDPSRTEKPTGKKINEVRQDGNVLSSPDVLSFVMILGGTLLLFITVPQMYRAFENSLRMITDIDCRQSWNNQTLINGAWTSLQILGGLLAPITFGLCFFAVITMRAQVGKYFSLKAIKWKFNAFNPASGIRSLLPSKHNLIKFLLTLAKVTVVSYLVYLLIKKDFDEILTLPFMPLDASLAWAVKRSYMLVFKILAMFMAIAVIDYVVKKRKYFEDMMMTKQEVKDERKNAEGDPIIKSKIRQKMRQMLRNRMARAIPGADVVIANPIHVAVALKYDADLPAPQVVAKGLRKRALLIKKIARENNVPIVEAPPLARSLYRTTKLGGYIQPQFYSAVAIILAKLQRNGKRAFIKAGEKVA